MAREHEFISLKEAAQISGYSSDYVGQLIRSGKLPGKQVFSNVAWMTTKDAVLAYLNKEKKSDESETPYQRAIGFFSSLEGVSTMYTYIMYVLVGFAALFLLFLVYILSVSIDHKIEEWYLERIEYEK